MQAPSAGNQQPWKFTVVKNKDKLMELSNMSPYASFVKYANVCIAISITNEDLIFRNLAPIDIGMSAENILLEAVKLGFGGTYLAVYPDKERINNVKKILDLDEEVVALISLGYPEIKRDVQYRFDKDKVKYVI